MFYLLSQSSKSGQHAATKVLISHLETKISKIMLSLKSATIMPQVEITILNAEKKTLRMQKDFLVLRYEEQTKSQYNTSVQQGFNYVQQLLKQYSIEDGIPQTYADNSFRSLTG